MTEHKESPKHLFARIRDVLLTDWDPLGLDDVAGTPDGYDEVAREVHAIVTGPEASVERIAAYLRWVEREQMHLQRRPGMASEAAEKVMRLLADDSRR